MSHWKRLFYYLLINVLVTACTMVTVLIVWERARPELFKEGDPLSYIFPLPTGQPGNTGQETLLPPTSEEAGVALQETETPLPTPTRGAMEYEVQPGDTLGAIANEFGVSMDELITANQLTDPDRLEPGMILIIPGEAPPPTAIPTETPRPATPTAKPSPTPTASGEAQVVITGIVGGGDLTVERVLLERSGPGELTLAGWQLLDEDGESFTFPQLTLFQDGSVNVNSRAGQQSVMDLFWGLDKAVWEPGETATLLDAAGVVRATYIVP